MKYSSDEESDLLTILVKLFPQSSRSTLRKMLTSGRVIVDGKICNRAKHEVVVGTNIEILDKVKAAEESPSPRAQYTGPKIDIIFEDESILVVLKPEGMLSIATNKLETDTLHSRCVDYVQFSGERNWCHIVHRLDRDTSGVMVFAKNKQHKETLQQQFAERSVQRTYHALVEGRPEKNSGTVSSWLAEDKHLHVRKVSSTYQGAKKAITHWNVEDSDDHVSLIHITIDTGKRHQIRMAMKDLGCPVVGDELHESTANPLNRVCLHATALEFLHPQSDAPVRFTSKVPFTGPESQR
ncbi:MAG: RluA family pseudouridine synthase [archaeon]|nr:RluA family pseudouridine synthase [archaeon]